MQKGLKYLFILTALLVSSLAPLKQEHQGGFYFSFISNSYAANKLPPPSKIKKPKAQKKAPAKKPSFKKKPQKKKATKTNTSSKRKSLRPREKHNKSLNQQKTTSSNLRPKNNNVIKPGKKDISLKAKFKNGGYPPNNGFKGNARKVFLRAGTKIDRYGSAKGNFASPLGTKLDKRSLAPGAEKLPYRAYIVKKPFPVTAGTVAPWFGKPGGGTQYMTKKSIDKLVKDGYLVELKGLRRR